jgi:hypothetical protein
MDREPRSKKVSNEENTSYFHIQQDMQQIKAAFDEVIDNLQRCLPTPEGKSTYESALVLHFDHRTGDLTMSGLNANHEDVRTILMIAFNRTFEKEIGSIEAAVEAKMSKPTFN